ncbi:TATA box-binding protein-associated factor RNA polymerase I subunit A-like [Arabidopsis thaliana x Arabidopsis arenosa]|uniref:TATA box-binding protein-associated factor RNA polymerase I subunit A-like n=1 Tax=Arabidopsis thaliana x Arabidopsis arenosa TaxID=1240361 RepID=A0A8T2C6Z7_9BRAS|nr:TATA box-binding protein-associated factor RNA polymerase I subunit A-like [Arabidopsis thaliana x Arabidopsis arenosa]
MVETEEKSEKLEETKAKRRRVNSSDIVSDTQKYKRIQRCIAKPSYLLSLGPKSSRSEYLNRLPGLLRELLRKRYWNDASRVLSVLMRGTIKDPCPKMNRLKYEAHIQIVSHLETKKNKADEIGRIYDTWIGQIGKQHKEERLLVWFEQICHFIDHEMNSEAYSAAISLMQNRDFAMLPRANLFIGITFYKMWCSKFLKELQPEDVDDNESVSNVSESRSGSLVECSGRDESVCSMASEVSAIKDSETSVRNNKKVSHLSISDSETRMDTKVKVKSTPHFTTPPQLYATSEENEASLGDGVEFDPTVINILGDMDPWLLPLKPPSDPDCYRKIVDDSYFKEALKHMRQTLQSPRHVSLAALHPLVQLLLIGGHVDEAMKVVEEMCNKVHDIKPFRIKALMMEKFHRNSDMLAKCYEDILKIDPCCVTTLKKVIGMCIEDEYSRESLIEMIALHVEASFPEPEIWKELASCFSHFFENLDEDRLSVCLDGSEDKKNPQTYSVRYNPTPKMFTNTSWTLRAKCWLNRHFSPEMLETETKNSILTGDWEMMTYKAACASHIYGREFGYVTKVYGLLKSSSNNREFFKFLREHRVNGNNIYNFE